MSTAPALVGDTVSTGVVSAGPTVGSGVRVIAAFERFAVNDRRVVVRRLPGLDGQRLRGGKWRVRFCREARSASSSVLAAGVPRTDVSWDVDADTGSPLVSADPAEAS